MVDHLAAFQGLESAVHELHYLATLWARLENEGTGGRREPDGTFMVRYESLEAREIHSFLGYEIERRSNALVKDFLACFELKDQADAK